MTPYEDCILRLITKNPGITKSALVRLQNGPQTKVRDALNALHTAGHIRPVPREARHGTITTWEAV